MEESGCNASQCKLLVCMSVRMLCACMHSGSFSCAQYSLFVTIISENSVSEVRVEEEKEVSFLTTHTYQLLLMPMCTLLLSVLLVSALSIYITVKLLSSQHCQLQDRVYAGHALRLCIN